MPLIFPRPELIPEIGGSGGGEGSLRERMFSPSFYHLDIVSVSWFEWNWKQCGIGVSELKEALTFLIPNVLLLEQNFIIFQTCVLSFHSSNDPPNLKSMFSFFRLIVLGDFSFHMDNEWSNRTGFHSLHVKDCKQQVNEQKYFPLVLTLMYKEIKVVFKRENIPF